MALQVRQFSGFKPGGKTRFMAATVSVQAEHVMQVLDLIEDAVSPRELIDFLSGPVDEYIQGKVLGVFADLGGGVPGGSWAPLQESTTRIRHALGYYDDYAINERSGDLMNWLIKSRTYGLDALGASMAVPGNDGNDVLRKKLRTAQLGYTQSGDDMIPGAHTPPRPVLQGWTSADELTIHKMLHWHIVSYVDFNSYM